jgi:hypothetical protein
LEYAFSTSIVLGRDYLRSIDNECFANVSNHAGSSFRACDVQVSTRSVDCARHNVGLSYAPAAAWKRNADLLDCASMKK